MSNRKARPKSTNVKDTCIKCKMKDLPTKSNMCRMCDPQTFYGTYKATK